MRLSPPTSRSPPKSPPSSPLSRATPKRAGRCGASGRPWQATACCTCTAWPTSPRAACAAICGHGRLPQPRAGAGWRRRGQRGAQRDGRGGVVRVGGVGRQQDVVLALNDRQARVQARYAACAAKCGHDRLPRQASPPSPSPPVGTRRALRAYLPIRTLVLNSRLRSSYRSAPATA